LNKDTTRGSEFDAAILEFRKLQDVECLGYRKEIVDLKGERLGDLGELCVSCVGRGG